MAVGENQMGGWLAACLLSKTTIARPSALQRKTVSRDSREISPALEQTLCDKATLGYRFLTRMRRYQHIPSTKLLLILQPIRFLWTSHIHATDWRSWILHVHISFRTSMAHMFVLLDASTKISGLVPLNFPSFMPPLSLQRVLVRDVVL